MTDRIRDLIASIEQWSPCMSYNDSYFGEPPGMLKQTIRQLAKEVEDRHIRTACTATSAVYPQPRITPDDLRDLKAKIDTAMAELDEVRTYDQQYLNYLRATSDLEALIDTIHRKTSK